MKGPPSATEVLGQGLAQGSSPGRPGDLTSPADFNSDYCILLYCNTHTVLYCNILSIYCYYTDIL